MTAAPATFVVRRVPGIPALGWCATVRRGAAQPEVLLGELVETGADTFFEGVWDCPFPEHGFLEAETVMGSGGRVEDDVVRCCSATHTLDHLYSLRDDDRVLVANSLPLLLAIAGDAPDPRYEKYFGAIAALWRGGTTASPATLPTAGGRSVLVHVTTDLTVDPDLSVELVDKHQPPEPADYSAYHEMLAGTVQRLVANGTDPQRRTPLHPVTTLSGGYDTSVCAVLGARAGVADAVTFRHESRDDSGAPVAAAMGLNLEVLERDAWRCSTEDIEVELVAANGGQSMPPLAALEGRWQAPMILLGSLGDRVWDATHLSMEDAQSIPDAVFLTSLGLHDFRLRAGMTFVHVPVIGAVHALAIARITSSAEMDPWRLGAHYDRPVARRIVEDAGVPRSAFAVRKCAGPAVDPDRLLRPAARADFDRYWHTLVRGLPFPSRWRARWGAWVVTPIVRVTRMVLYRLRIGRITWSATRHSLGRWYFYRSLPASYRFHWAVQRLTDRYAAALEGQGTTRAS